MNLPALLDAGLQALNLRPKAATEYDLTLLQKALVGTDSLGRLNPVTYTGGALNWLDPSTQDVRKRLVGQVGRVNSYFAKKAAAVPWSLWRTGKDGKPEQVTNSPLLDLLWRPNPMNGYVAFMRQMSTLYHGAGDVFVWANRVEGGNNAGRATELWILPNRNVRVVGGGPMQEVEKYVFTPDLTKPGNTVDLLAEDVLHLKNDPLPDERYGVSVIVSANREATGDQASITAQVAQLQNQGPAGVLSFEPVDNKPVQLGETVVPDMRRRLGRDFTGPENRGQFPIMTQAVRWTAIGATAVDLDILKFREANFRDICSWWSVPSVLLGDMAASTDNNYQNARKAMYTDGILPYLESVVAEFSRWLCPMFEKGTWLQVDTSGIPELQQDKATLAGWLKDAWFIPVERRAEMLGETPDAGFTGYFVPAGLVHVQSTAELNAEGQKQLGRFEEYPGVREE